MVYETILRHINGEKRVHIEPMYWKLTSRNVNKCEEFARSQFTMIEAHSPHNF